MRKEVLAILAKAPRGGLGRKEIARLLKLHGRGHEPLGATLDQLVRAGSVVRLKGERFVLPRTPNITGILSVAGPGYGFVEQEGGEDILVPARHIGTAMSGDQVELEPIPSHRPGRPAGRVVRVLERKATEFIGTARKGNGRWTMVLDRSTPERGIRLIPSEIQVEEGDVVRAGVTDWGGPHSPVLAKTLEVVGSIHSPISDMTVICRKFDLRHDFPAGAAKEAEGWSEKHIREEAGRRTDFRALDVFTIDPVDARDFDDAVSLERRPDGSARVGVHIADVSHFVRAGSELDREARRRGTSVYFSEGAIHMLPKRLSADLCSLVENEDRLAVSAIIDFDRTGQVQDAIFYDSVIRNRHRFSYREVQSILDGVSTSPHAFLLRELRDLSRTLRKKREEKGSIDFDIPEPIFRFGPEGIPHEILPAERMDSHRLVEEFMLLANRLVAKNVPLRAGPKPFIYRVHEKPIAGDVAKFVEVVRRLGGRVSAVKELHQKEFKSILKFFEGSPYQQLIESLALRAMTKAKYDTVNHGHYGLAFEHYTHFTSPIRRYPDLIVHRLMKAFVLRQGSNREGWTEGLLSAIARDSSAAEALALQAERDYIRLKQIRWLSQRVGKTYRGRIAGMIGSGLFVQLDQAMVEGFISSESLKAEGYEFRPAQYSYVSRRGGEALRFGDAITIRVKDVDLDQRQALFQRVQGQPDAHE